MIHPMPEDATIPYARPMASPSAWVRIGLLCGPALAAAAIASVPVSTVMSQGWTSRVAVHTLLAGAGIATVGLDAYRSVRRRNAKSLRHIGLLFLLVGAGLAGVILLGIRPERLQGKELFGVLLAVGTVLTLYSGWAYLWYSGQLRHEQLAQEEQAKAQTPAGSQGNERQASQ